MQKQIAYLIKTFSWILYKAAKKTIYRRLMAPI